MADHPKDRTEPSSDLPRNFTVSLEARLRALASGPRAYMRRRRRIEDLEKEILDDLAACHDLYASNLLERIATKVQMLNDLIERHNRFFPIEANLPMDPQTGSMLELGHPWTPMPRVDLAVLIARARTQASR